MTDSIITRFHADGTVTYWSVYRQQWIRTDSIPYGELASMDWVECRIVRAHLSGTLTLDQLFDAIRECPPLLHDELPTFGGPDPTDLNGVWSWDETRVLVGSCADDLDLIDREDR